MKRKFSDANAHIYMMTFITTIFLLTFVVYTLRNVIFPKVDTGITFSAEDKRPDSSYNGAYLFMLSENKGGRPDYFVLLLYRPSADIMTALPLAPNTAFGEKTLRQCYDTGGASEVRRNIEKSFGITTKGYVKFDRDTLVSFIDTMPQKIPMQVPVAIEGAGLNLTQGANLLDGETAYKYLAYCGFSDKNYMYQIEGAIFANFINANLQGQTAKTIQASFDFLISNTDTDLTLDNFIDNQNAYLYTVRNTPSPADYYIPYGDTKGDTFIISGTSLQTVKERFGLNN